MIPVVDEENGPPPALVTLPIQPVKCLACERSRGGEWPEIVEPHGTNHRGDEANVSHEHESYYIFTSAALCHHGDADGHQEDAGNKEEHLHGHECISDGLERETLQQVLPVKRTI